VEEDKHFMVESYQNVDGAPSFLRVETEKEHVEIPKFINIIKDVTNSPHFSTLSLA
jgi:hypothetical protein